MWDSLFVFQPEQNDSSLTDEPLWTFEPVDEIIEGSAHVRDLCIIYKCPFSLSAFPISMH